MKSLVFAIVGTISFANGCTREGEFAVTFDSAQFLESSSCLDQEIPKPLTRVAYRSDVATGVCESETQQAICSGSNFLRYSGSFEHDTCQEQALFYSKEQATYGETCNSLARQKSRLCLDGSCEEWDLSDAFTFSSCSETSVVTTDLSATVFNDSVGHQARFRWANTSETTTVAIAFSADLNSIISWQGNTATVLPSGMVIENYENCSGQSLNDEGLFVDGEQYSSSFTNGPMNGAGRCGINLTASDIVGGPLSPWERRYFKIAFLVDDRISFSKVYAAGNVPPGMVFVDKELWPEAWFPRDDFPVCDDPTGHLSSLGCRFDFAIDKYEVSDPSGSAVNRTGLYPNTFSVALESRKGAATAGSFNFNSFKQGCLNRSYLPELAPYVDVSDLDVSDSNFVFTPTPLRKVHMSTAITWIVASYTSPRTIPIDLSCRRDSLSVAGAIENCVSDFGAMDMVGNAWEFTDEVIDHPNDERDYLRGTTEEYINARPAVFDGVNYGQYLTGFDFSTLTPEIGGSIDDSVLLFFDSDWYWSDDDSEGFALRGGNHSQAGRTRIKENGSFTMSFASGDSGAFDQSSRCALVSP